jgi:hypothetical protein
MRNDDAGAEYFFRRGDAALTCEARLNPDGTGYQLVIIENGVKRIETFAELRDLLAREHELVRAWRAQGWRDPDQPTRRSVDPRTGLR